MKTAFPTLPLVAHWPLNGGVRDSIAGNHGSGSPMVCSMAVHGGELYAGIADAASDGAMHEGAVRMLV
jgi:hypothetical protein